MTREEKKLPDKLEEAAEEWCKTNNKGIALSADKKSHYLAEGVDAFKAGAVWQKEQDLAEMALSKSPLSVAYANRCFENGKQAMKEQMMEKSYLATISANNTIPVLPMKEVSDIGLDYGDKVRVIVIKEDK